MSKLVNETEYLLAWLVFWLCSTFGGFILGAVAGGIIGGIMGAAGADIQSIKIIAGVMGFIISIPLSCGLFRLFVSVMIVKKIAARISTMQTASPGADLRQ